MTGAGVEGLEAEVVEDEEIGAAEGFDEARMSPVASGEHEVAAKLRPAMIEDGAIVAAGFVADGGRRRFMRLRIEPIVSEAFAPFGQILAPRSVNEGRQDLIQELQTAGSRPGPD